MVQVHLQLWRKTANGQRGECLIDATAKNGALETGGGPWPEAWKAEAKMQQPLKSIVQLPFDVKGIAQALPGGKLPPGL